MRFIISPNTMLLVANNYGVRWKEAYLLERNDKIGVLVNRTLNFSNINSISPVNVNTLKVYYIPETTFLTVITVNLVPKYEIEDIDTNLNVITKPLTTMNVNNFEGMYVMLEFDLELNGDLIANNFVLTCEEYIYNIENINTVEEVVNDKQEETQK